MLQPYVFVSGIPDFVAEKKRIATGNPLFRSFSLLAVDDHPPGFIYIIALLEVVVINAWLQIFSIE